MAGGQLRKKAISSGEAGDDRVNESWYIQRICVVLCALILGSTASAQQGAGTYRIVDTGLERCYGNAGEIAFPERGQPFCGQDAQYQGFLPAYRDNGDGTTADLNTGLMWQKTPDFVKRTLDEAEENAIYFASVNTAMRFQNSATSLIAPDGRRVAHVPYGEEKILVRSIDLAKATRLYAKRYNPRWYPA